MSTPSYQSTPTQPVTLRSAAAELIAPSDPRWRMFLVHVPHDVYHLPEYTEISARYEGGEPVAFLAASEGTEVLLPLRIRELPGALHAPPDWRDAASPYGYPGPLATDPADSHGVEACLTAIMGAARAAGLVSAFVRLHPLLSPPVGTVGLAGEVEAHGSVVYLDLTRSEEELWSQVRSNHRRGIRKLTRQGYSVTMDDWDTYTEFVRVYEATMRRVDASPFYFFSTPYYDDLRCALLDHVHLCTVRTRGGHVAAAGIFFETAGIVQYHLGGTADEFVSDAPSKLMFHAVREWARARGNRVLHLGGGLGGRSDSLFHFKSGFSSLRASFHTLRVAFDDARYTDLLRRAGAEQATGFFPAYRAS